MEENNFKAKGRDREQALAFFSPLFRRLWALSRRSWQEGHVLEIKAPGSRRHLWVDCIHRGCGSLCQKKGSLCLADVLNLHDSLLVLIITAVSIGGNSFSKMMAFALILFSSVYCSGSSQILVSIRIIWEGLLKQRWLDLTPQFLIQ